MNILLLILLTINILTFILFGVDKHLALKNKRRISENNLHTFSILGGFVGAFLAMFLFRHKIKKLSFILVQLFILLLWVSFIAFELYNNIAL
jgi:uncharacterized membrane protein YsdA (DUF1294 family)